MHNKEQSCRHEYVKIFHRRYKGSGRRLVVTRGYLPTGFSVKDFSYLNADSYCFCAHCRFRLHPARIDAAKLMRIEKLNQIAAPEMQLGENEAYADQVNNIWVEENACENGSVKTNELQEINVEELQVESVDVSDIADKKVVEAEEISPQGEEELC